MGRAWTGARDGENEVKFWECPENGGVAAAAAAAQAMVLYRERKRGEVSVDERRGRWGGRDGGKV